MADGCQRDHPMNFCSECGTWLHCKPDGAADYVRRPDRANDSDPAPGGNGTQGLQHAAEQELET